MNNTKVAFSLLASFLIWSSHTYANENFQELTFCQEDNHQDGHEFNPLIESAKTFAESSIGEFGGRNLSKLVGSFVTNGFFVRRAGMIAGRILVWIFDAGNPAQLALGFILEPNTSAKCDVLYSDDPECINGNSCIKPLSALYRPSHH
jgi:hypothetical protein